MQKFSQADIKPFQFSELESATTGASSSFQAFSFQTIDGRPFNKERVTDETIRQERTFEKKNDFKIDDTVRDLRGLSRQEENDVELRIRQEVERRLKEAHEAAYQEGLEKGRAQGREEALQTFQQKVDVRISDMEQMLGEVNIQCEELLARNQKDITEFVKRFTKWIVLKEINEKTYLTGLLEKLILELNARRNLIIKVGQKNFAEMPEVVAAVEARLGQLSNVRIEIVPELHYPGIILEAENGLIDGSLEGVFQNIDKIFEQVNADE